MIPPDYKDCKESAWQRRETDYFLCVTLALGVVSAAKSPGTN